MHIWACRGPRCCQRYGTDMPEGVHRTEEQLEAMIERHEMCMHNVQPLVVEVDGRMVNYSEPIGPRLSVSDRNHPSERR